MRGRETGLLPEHETFPGEQANIFEEVSNRRSLAAAVDGLPPTQRQAVRLLKLEERSLKEAAAAISGMSVASLKVAAHRALKSLRRVLAKWDAER